MASQIPSLAIVYSTVFRRRSKKTSKLRVTGLCVGNSQVTNEFPAQRASNAENVSIWWRYHDCLHFTDGIFKSILTSVMYDNVPVHLKWIHKQHERVLVLYFYNRPIFTWVFAKGSHVPWHSHKRREDSVYFRWKRPQQATGLDASTPMAECLAQFISPFMYILDLSLKAIIYLIITDNTHHLDEWK